MGPKDHLQRAFHELVGRGNIAHSCRPGLGYLQGGRDGTKPAPIGATGRPALWARRPTCSLNRRTYSLGCLKTLMYLAATGP